jgi:hypothetical protein
VSEALRQESKAIIAQLQADIDHFTALAATKQAELNAYIARITELGYYP